MIEDGKVRQNKVYMAKIIVEGTEIAVIKSNDEDYISLTDMIKE